MLHVIVPIVVGGIIGYFTNYIAIKMLFRPRMAKYIGKWRVPFTPGVIPKNQPRIANAVGIAVSEQLMTKEAMIQQLQESGIREKMTASIVDSMLQVQILVDESQESTMQMVDTVSDKMITQVQNADILPLIREIGNQSLQDYLRNPMIAMFLNASMLEGIYAKIDTSLKAYVEEHGKQMVRDFINKKADGKNAVLASSLFEVIGMDKNILKEKVGYVFDTFLAEKSDELLATLDVKKIVTDKINAMKVDELEDLVMYVMENELKAVINLGAVIGALIGMVNIFI